MKNFPLVFMYLFVFGLIVVSCNKEMSDAELSIELTSPDNLLLASSEAELKEMMLETLRPIYGQDYDFEITNVFYRIEKDLLTDADVSYRTVDGLDRNLIFYWMHKDLKGEGDNGSAILKAAPACQGACDLTSTCRSVRTVKTGIYRCKCGTNDPAGQLGSENCLLIIDPGVGHFCDEVCNNENLGIGNACQPAYDPATGEAECYCLGSPDGSCGGIDTIHIKPDVIVIGGL